MSKIPGIFVKIPIPKAFVACSIPLILSCCLNTSNAKRMIAEGGEQDSTVREQKIKYNYGTNDKELTIKQRNLKGAVKTVTTLRPKSELADDKLDLKNVDSFDIDGYLAASYEFGEPGNHPNKKSVFVYDTKRRLVARKVFSLDSRTIISWAENSYDQFGNETDRSIYGEDSNLQVKRTTKYNGKGNVVQTMTYSSFFDDSTVYSYSNKGYTMTKQSFRNGRIRPKEVSEYDGKGNCTKVISYTRDGAIDLIQTLYYNNEGKMTEMLSNSEAGKLLLKLQFKYDAYGNQIEQKAITPDGGKDPMTDLLNYSLTLQYDKHGNINHEAKYELKDGKPTMVEEKKYEIVYYH